MSSVWPDVYMVNICIIGVFKPRPSRSHLCRHKLNQWTLPMLQFLTSDCFKLLQKFLVLVALTAKLFIVRNLCIKSSSRQIGNNVMHEDRILICVFVERNSWLYCHSYIEDCVIWCRRFCSKYNFNTLFRIFSMKLFWQYKIVMLSKRTGFTNTSIYLTH